MRTGRRPFLGPLGVRLALAFLTVALAAIAVFAALTMLSARSEVSGLTDRQREEDLSATAIAAGAIASFATAFGRLSHDEVMELIKRQTLAAPSACAPGAAACLPAPVLELEDPARL